MATKVRRTKRPANRKNNKGKKDKNFESVGAAWERTSKNGTEFLAITLNADVDLTPFTVTRDDGTEVIQLSAFINGFKEEDKHPDFNIVGFND